MIGEKTVHIIYTKISTELPEEIYKKYLIFLPETLRNQNFRFKRWQDKTANLLSKILLIKGLQKFGFDYSSLEILKYNRYGRPHIAEDIDFNISHSGDYVLCAIAGKMRLGIDIEEIKSVDFSDFHELMTDKQWEIIKDSNDPLKAFFRFWAIKESIIKADGRGLSIPLNDIYIEESIAHYEKKWYLKELEFDNNYCANLAIDFETPLINKEFIDIYSFSNVVGNDFQNNL